MWVDIPGGTPVGTIAQRECSQGHRFRVRVEETKLSILPAEDKD
jgi:hypothetical protein